MEFPNIPNLYFSPSLVRALDLCAIYFPRHPLNYRHGLIKVVFMCRCPPDGRLKVRLGGRPLTLVLLMGGLI